MGVNESKYPFPRTIEGGSTKVKEDQGNKTKGKCMKTNRERTDPNWFRAFIFGVIGMVALVGASVYFGNVRRLTHAANYQGQLCGIDAGLEDSPHVFICGNGKFAGNYPEELDFHSRSCVKNCPNTSLTKIACLRPPAVVFNESANDFLTNYKMNVQQTVEQGDGYNTEPIGKYCVPKENPLRNLVLDVIRNENPFAKIAASFMHGWPLLLITFFLAILLGIGTLCLLKEIPGPLMFASMVLFTLCLLVGGIFFCLALFIPDVENEKAWYNEFNPIVHSYLSNEGRFLSVLFGLVLLAFGTCMGVTTLTALPEIDKAVGAVNAACDCIFGKKGCCKPLLLEAVMKAFLILVQLALCMVGLALVSSVGYIQNDGISINGDAVAGLQGTFVWYPFWEWAIFFYVVMTWWLFEFQVARYQFAVTYAVCSWFFYIIPKEEPGSTHKVPVDGGRAHLQARVGGVDNHDPNRPAMRVKAGNQELLVAPVGQRGPKGDRLGLTPTSVEFDSGKIQVKEMTRECVSDGNFMATMHIGSLAKGSIICFLTRPFRVFSTAARALLGKSTDRKFNEDPGGTVKEAFKALVTLVLTMIETTFMGLSKNAYCAIVLNSLNFGDAAVQAKLLLEDAGGSVSFLHGTTGLYEIICILLISSICGGVSSMLLIWLPMFSDPGNYHLYVEDSNDLVITCTVMSFFIAYGFMSLFNVVLDSMLYVLSWSRKNGIEVYHDDGSKKEWFTTKTLCSKALRSLFTDSQLESAPDDQGALKDIKSRNPNFGLGANHFWHSMHAAGSHALATARGTQKSEYNPLLSTAPGQ